MGDLKLKVRGLDDDCMKYDKEREKANEEKYLIEKRARIEEDSLKKRIQMHEEFAN
jgi:hypothetical protein